MSQPVFYSTIGIGLFCIGLYALIVQSHLLRRILAINIMGSGVFLLLVALGGRGTTGIPDPVAHAMVITGIVVAVSATALALVIMLQLSQTSGRAQQPDKSQDSRH